MALFLRKPTRQPKKILVARTDRIGDFVLTLPVFEAIKTRVGSDVAVLCQEMVTPLLTNNPFVDTIITTTGKGNDDIAREIKDHSFDCLLVLVNDRTIRGLLPKLRSIPIRVGPLSKFSVFFQFTHPVIQKRSRSIQNEAAYNLELLEIFGTKTIDPVRPRLYISEKERVEGTREIAAILGLDKLPSSYIVFHQGMGGSALNWRESYYAELLEKIVAMGKIVILTGASQEEIKTNRESQERLAPRFPSQLFDLTGRLSLRKLAILLSQADLFIGPSTGPTHLANAVGAKIISFYPPIQVQSTTRWEPFLGDNHLFVPPVHCGQTYRCLNEKCENYYCMDLITPHHVLKKLNVIWREIGTSSRFPNAR